MNPAPTTAAETTRAPGSASRSAAVRILPQTEAETAAVLAFNDRMRDGRAPTDFVLPDKPDARCAPDAAVRWLQYLAVDDAGQARGGFILMQQRGWLNGEAVPVANYQSPVSEGILDKRYGMVGMHMLRFVERQFPLAFVVGMGAADRPLPRLLSAAGWKIVPVPFLFRIVRARHVLRQLRPLRERPLLRAAATAAALTGGGWLAAQVLHRRGRLMRAGAVRLEQVDGWGPWADALWQEVRHLHAFTVARDRATLEDLYPLAGGTYAAYTLHDGERILGWAVCAQAEMREHAYFGNLKVATVLDAVAIPEAAAALVSTLSRRLGQWADLIITNQSHSQWVGAFERCGFASTRSNYLLALSKRLAEAVGSSLDRVHVTRGDGDGRIHLV